MSCDMQEELLFLPRTAYGRDPITEPQVRPVAANPDWSRQRRAWRALQMPKADC